MPWSPAPEVTGYTMYNIAAITQVVWTDKASLFHEISWIFLNLFIFPSRFENRSRTNQIKTKSMFLTWTGLVLSDFNKHLSVLFILIYSNLYTFILNIQFIQPNEHRAAQTHVPQTQAGGQGHLHYLHIHSVGWQKGGLQAEGLDYNNFFWVKIKNLKIKSTPPEARCFPNFLSF